MPHATFHDEPSASSSCAGSSPWRYTRTGRPVFVSRSYDEHEAEWITKEQAGDRLLWEMAAIAHSLVGFAAREKDAQGRVRDFAGVVRRSASLVYSAADAYRLRVALEDQGCSRLQALTEGLTFKHFTVTA